MQNNLSRYLMTRYPSFQYSTPQYSTTQYLTPQYSLPQYSTPQYSTQKSSKLYFYLLVTLLIIIVSIVLVSLGIYFYNKVTKNISTITTPTITTPFRTSRITTTFRTPTITTPFRTPTITTPTITTPTITTPTITTPTITTPTITTPTITTPTITTPTITTPFVNDFKENYLIRRYFVYNSTNIPDNEQKMNNLFFSTQINTFTFNNNLSLPTEDINYFGIEYTTWLTFSDISIIEFMIDSDDGSDIFYYTNNNWTPIATSYGGKSIGLYPGYSHIIKFNPNILYPIRIRYYQISELKNLILKWRGNFGDINQETFIDINFNHNYSNTVNKYNFKCNNKNLDSNNNPTFNTIISNNFPNPSTINNQEYILENFLIKNIFNNKYSKIIVETNKEFVKSNVNYTDIFNGTTNRFSKTDGNILFSLTTDGLLINNNDKNFFINEDGITQNTNLIKETFNFKITKWNFTPILNSDGTINYYIIKSSRGKYLILESDILYTTTNNVIDTRKQWITDRYNKFLTNTMSLLNIPFIFNNKRIKNKNSGRYICFDKNNPSDNIKLYHESMGSTLLSYYNSKIVDNSKMSIRFQSGNLFLKNTETLTNSINFNFILQDTYTNNYQDYYISFYIGDIQYYLYDDSNDSYLLPYKNTNDGNNNMKWIIEDFSIPNNQIFYIDFSNDFIDDSKNLVNHSTDNYNYRTPKIYSLRHKDKSSYDISKQQTYLYYPIFYNINSNTITFSASICLTDVQENDACIMGIYNPNNNNIGMIKFYNNNLSYEWTVTGTSNNLQITTFDTGISLPYQTPLSWNHVVLTIQENGVKWYKDGSELKYLGQTNPQDNWVSSSTKHSMINFNNQNIYIGDMPGKKKFKGYITNLGFYNRVLTNEEIQKLYDISKLTYN